MHSCEFSLPSLKALLHFKANDCAHPLEKRISFETSSQSCKLQLWPRGTSSKSASSSCDNEACVRNYLRRGGVFLGGFDGALLWKWVALAWKNVRWWCVVRELWDHGALWNKLWHGGLLWHWLVWKWVVRLWVVVRVTSEMVACCDSELNCETLVWWLWHSFEEISNSYKSPYCPEMASYIFQLDLTISDQLFSRHRWLRDDQASGCLPVARTNSYEAKHSPLEDSSCGWFRWLRADRQGDIVKFFTVEFFVNSLGQWIISTELTADGWPPKQFSAKPCASLWVDDEGASVFFWWCLSSLFDQILMWKPDSILITKCSSFSETLSVAQELSCPGTLWLIAIW